VFGVPGKMAVLRARGNDTSAAANAALTRYSRAVAPRSPFDNLTTSGHHLVMKAVRVTELKSHLSHHLREVRAGESLTVYDRTTPVARLVPVDRGDDLWLTRPLTKAPPVGLVKLPRARPIDIDVVDMLLRDRQSRR
jgi:prevent-host-death family protein